MLTIYNKEKLLGHGFISNGKEWRITNIKESYNEYYITVECGNRTFEHFTFKLDRDKGNNAGYGMVTLDWHNNNVDWNIIFAHMIETKTAMICELQLIMNKFYK